MSFNLQEFRVVRNEDGTFTAVTLDCHGHTMHETAFGEDCELTGNAVEDLPRFLEWFIADGADPDEEPSMGHDGSSPERLTRHQDRMRTWGVG